MTRKILAVRIIVMLLLSGLPVAVRMGRLRVIWKKITKGVDEK